MPARELAHHIWEIKESLRGVYDDSEVKDVILPFTLLRRLDCVLDEYREVIMNELRGEQEDEQRAIASILSTLDDKIDLLHRQNETLEKIAETLFRQWFIEEAQDDWEEVPLSSIAKFHNGIDHSHWIISTNILVKPLRKKH